MRIRRALIASTSLLLGLGACGGLSGGRGRQGTVPVQPDLPPLPDFVEVCVSKAIVLPSKIDGQAWDGIGRARRQTRKLLPEIVAASQSGGYEAALLAAGELGVGVFNHVKGPPDVRVSMQLGRPMVIRSEMNKDATISAFNASEDNCAVIEAKEYGERVQFVVEDLDVGRPDLIGTTSFIGIPEDALRSGTWRLNGFDGVVELELTLQPMEKPAAPRPELNDEAEPPSVPDDEGPVSDGEEATEPSN